MNTIEQLVSELKSLRRAYVNLLESGRDRILDLGGTCDPVDVMEAGNPHLASAVKAIAAGEAELKREPVELAKKFHDTYERLAPTFGYETRANTKQFDPESANGRLMTAVCAEITREETK